MTAILYPISRKYSAIVIPVYIEASRAATGMFEVLAITSEVRDAGGDYQYFDHLLTRDRRVPEEEQAGKGNKPEKPSQPFPRMTRDESIGLEYCGSSLNRLFAQRLNLLRPSFHRMLRDIVRFNREAKVWLESGADARSLGELLAEGGFSGAFISRYIVPMGSAIWSASPEKLLEFPARFFLRFLDNHGLLTVNGQHQWYVIEGGSKRYVDRIIFPFEDRIRLRTPIRSVGRHADRVVVTPVAGEPESFDQVILATHSDQALALLEDPTDAEREILGAIPYEQNDVVLHTDTRLLPRSPRARAAWNYQKSSSANNSRLILSLEQHWQKLKKLCAKS